MERYVPQPEDLSGVTLPDEVLALTEQIARNVHEIWAQGREAQGWKYGEERNDALRLHPGLVAYEKLTEPERDYDRRTALETLKLIVKLGFEIRRKEPAE